MNKGPGLFSNFGKNSRDLLYKDYSWDQKITVSSVTSSGLALASNLVKKGGLSAGDVTAQFTHKHAAVDLIFQTETNILTVLSVIDYPNSTRTIATMNLPDYRSGKLEVQYLDEHASFTAAASLNKSPALDVSAAIGTPSIAFGAEATYDTSSGKFMKYNAGVSFVKPDSNASVILADKGDSIRASYLHHLTQLNGGAVVGEISRKFSTNENTLTVGCAYVVDTQTLLKAKLNNHGSFGALLQHEVKPRSFLTISGDFDTKALQKTPRFGLALSLKP